MAHEIDVHDLSNSKGYFGRDLQLTKQCAGCRFHYLVVNRDWGSGQKPIGEACLWGAQWGWLEYASNPRSCSKLSRPLPVESASLNIVEKNYKPCGIDGDKFNLELFTQVVKLYSRIMGICQLHEAEISVLCQGAVEDLSATNATGIRLGSALSGDSKLTIEWRDLPGIVDPVLFFSCYPQAHMSNSQGEFLAARFEMAVQKLLIDEDIAVFPKDSK